MADRGHWDGVTDNRAVVIAQMNGHRVPDTTATSSGGIKFGDAHPSEIHDPYERYGNDSPCDDPC